MIGTLILAALIVIVLFGAKRLPELMGALWKSGQTMKRPKRTFTPGMKGRLVEFSRRLEAAIRKEECLLKDQGFTPRKSTTLSFARWRKSSITPSGGISSRNLGPDVIPKRVAMQISGHKTRRYNIVREGNTPFHPIAAVPERIGERLDCPRGATALLCAPNTEPETSVRFAEMGLSDTKADILDSPRKSDLTPHSF